MTLVDNDVLPRHLTQGRLIIEDVLVGSEDDMEFVIFEMLSQQRPLLLLTLIDNLADTGSPLVKLHAPVRDCGQRDYHQERSLITLRLNQMTEEGDRLNSLSQTHFISEDAIQIVVVQTDKPVETYHLIRLELAALDHLRLLLYLLLHSVSNGVINLARVFEVGFDLFIFRKILFSLFLFIVVLLHLVG
jgi:hypothetical protein